ncbi:hypothetical protein ACFYVL_31810 [Streptomyces sp. NPDC004111]|uniref:hypothetical protein n=1 Tax=Streptomyces sp. NPDC004111 TaxID=3364690 RepID=UPI0036BFAC91
MAEVELQIDQATVVSATEAIAAVRCTLGPVRRGARFDRLRDLAEAIDLELTQILAYHRSVEELDPVHTALVTLQGRGVQHLTSATPGSHWQVIQGTNPPTS